MSGPFDRIVIDGATLAVYRTGRGPAVVCLNALAHDAHDFDAFAERVGDRYEVICIEWPGHGASGADAQPASAARYADLLAGALDELGVDRPILVGNSIGGAAAILCASRRPVRGLVLCNSGGLVEITPLVARFCAVFERFFAAGERGAAWFDLAFRIYYQFVLPTRVARSQRHRIVSGARERAPLLRQAWKSFGEPEADLRSVAAGLDIPIWVAWARDDLTIPLSFVLPAVGRLKRATISRFKGGHSAFMEDPDAFARAFLLFASGLSEPDHREDRTVARVAN